jgi:hypothetical protein
VVAAGIAGLRRAWSARRDWIVELDRIVVSRRFRGVVATSPDRVARMIERADSPQRLNHGVAELAAATAANPPPT